MLHSALLAHPVCGCCVIVVMVWVNVVWTFYQPARQYGQVHYSLKSSTSGINITQPQTTENSKWSRRKIFLKRALHFPSLSMRKGNVLFWKNMPIRHTAYFIPITITISSPIISLIWSDSIHQDSSGKIVEIPVNWFCCVYSCHKILFTTDYITTTNWFG